MTVVKRLARPLGLLILAIAFVFLSREMLAYREELGNWRPTPAVLWSLLGLSVVQGAALLLQAESWHRIVGLFGDEPRHRTYPSYTATMIARYLPGNVFHIVGRAAWLRGGALSDGALARASLLELMVTPAGAVVVLIGLLPFLPIAQYLPPVGTMAALGAAAVVLAAAVLFSARHWLHNWIPSALQMASGAVPALLASTLFMIALAAVFAGITSLLGDVSPIHAMGAALIGWTLGYATPGAPAGLGTREAVLVALLGGSMGADAAILAALLFRVVTAFGDIVCLGLGAALAAYFRQGSTLRTAG